MKTNKLLFLMILFFCSYGFAEERTNMNKVKEFRIERGLSDEAVACIKCHQKESPGIFADWAKSRHAHANITCIDCHKADETDPDLNKAHFKQYQSKDNEYGKEKYRVGISTVVTPKDCSRCHPDEAKEYSKSKHANTVDIMWKIDSWLKKGMNSEEERKSGCYHCHGTVLKLDKDGNLDKNTWPNVGVGRINLDGSKGSCTSCHTRHRFSIAEARKPEACGQCHLGPDHPQIEIYTESKHGAMYSAFKDEYNFGDPPGNWTPGIDYRSPTCSSCHISGAGSVLTTHNVTERLSWEMQSPLTVRPENFEAFPSKTTTWDIERGKMQEICMQCHTKSWVEGHYDKMDKVVEEYNEVYYKPAKKVMDELYAKKLVDNTKMFDEPIEFEFYELWHHEGRRARMGAAMMAPDYSWWHGFYEVKKRFISFLDEAKEMLTHNKKAHKTKNFPNATGSTEKL